MFKKRKIAVVIPCYKVSRLINKVIKSLPKFIDNIYVVDDACPEKSVKKIKFKSRKLKKIFRKKNGGVGAAVKDGYKASIKDENDITVRIDGDGQMNPDLITHFINPIINKNADFTKGNRFKNLKFLTNMPFLRILGNTFFSLIGMIVIKNVKIFDFQNGFTCIDNKLLKKVIKKLENDFFFENSLIYNLSKLNCKILDIDMEAIYGEEKSNLNILSVGLIILYKYFLISLNLKK